MTMNRMVDEQAMQEARDYVAKEANGMPQGARSLLGVLQYATLNSRFADAVGGGGVWIMFTMKTGIRRHAFCCDLHRCGSRCAHDADRRRRQWRDVMLNRAKYSPGGALIGFPGIYRIGYCRYGIDGCKRSRQTFKNQKQPLQQYRMGEIGRCGSKGAST